MAIIYSADLKPSKMELIQAWLPSQAWFSGDVAAVERLGSFRFDDPEGEVGVETLLVGSGDSVFQVPLTYRGAPLEGAEAFLIGTMEHSVLGTRYVYDAPADPVYATELVASIINAKPQAVMEHPAQDGTMEILPESVEIYSKGTAANVLPELSLSAPVTDDAVTSIPAGSLTLQVVRALDLAGSRPNGTIGSPDLHATWAGQDSPVLIAKA